MITVIDEELSIPRYSSVCSFCKHWQAPEERSCTAFPKGTIPIPIWEGDNDHKKPYPGDHGIQFEPLEL
jgi:hypothetical protein